MEFALVLVPLLLITFGIIQFGFAWHRNQSIQAAAREGARLASIGADENSIRSRVNETKSLFADGDIIIQVNGSPIGAGSSQPCSSIGFNNPVNVEVIVPERDDYGLVIPLWGSRNIEFRGSAVFRCENG